MKRLALACALLAACGKPELSTDDPKQRALTDVKQYIQQNLDDLHASVVQLRADAPAPDADGWSASSDAAAVAAMKADWKKARTSYEHIEGAIAVLFAGLDVSTDERYDGFLADFGPDTNLFDDQGVTGIHGIERILWSDSIPQKVIAFESQLPGYQPARFPQNQQEADDFKNKLCQRLVDDVESMRTQFAPLALDPRAAYRGVIGSMREQVEKAEKAAGGEEESRYAQYTLADMRTNVEAGEQIYALFRPWLRTKSNGLLLDSRIQSDFARLHQAYDQAPGDSLPDVPATWSSTNPSPADLQTPFGKLWQSVKNESDGNQPGSLVDDLEQSASTLGIAAL